MKTAASMHTIGYSVVTYELADKDFAYEWFWVGAYFFGLIFPLCRSCLFIFRCL